MEHEDVIGTDSDDDDEDCDVDAGEIGDSKDVSVDD